MKFFIFKTIAIYILISACLCCFCNCSLDNNSDYLATIDEIYTIEESENQIFINRDEIAEINTTYVLNINSKKIHTTTCGTGKTILPRNKKIYKGDVMYLYQQGYTKCGNCFRWE